jgi:ABC-type multidrug transport system fused ATPase/permease subunit
LFVLLLLWALSDQVVGGALSAADFLMFFMYAFVFVRPLAMLVGVYGAVNRMWGSALRVAHTFAEPLESRAGQELGSFVDKIRVEGLRFAYPGRRQLLKSVDFELAKGQIILLVGANGAGKSTLLRLLFKFLEPQAGSIKIDGRDYAELSAASVRRLFSLVPQETLLLSGSIYDNIALHAPDATTERVARAAKLASADEFIDQLPEGYQTRVGEGGILLSGGQRQRIALARALLQDAPILILDEATSMLDRETEARFWESCQRALTARTALIIGHHLSSLPFPHKVVRIDEGRLVVCADRKSAQHEARSRRKKTLSSIVR